MAKPKSTDYMMDAAAKKLRKLHDVIEWLLDHYHQLPTNLYQLVNDEFIPIDIREYLFYLTRQDFANAITPTVLWKSIAREEGALADGITTEFEDEGNDAA